MNGLFYPKRWGETLLMVFLSGLGIGTTFFFFKFIIDSSIWCLPYALLSLIFFGFDGEIHKDLFSMHINILQNDIPTLTYLLERAKNVNQKGDKDRTPLMMATATNNLEAMRLILKHNPSLEAQDEKGNSALKLASHADVAKLLLEHGANVNTKCHLGRTALMFAAEAANVETVKVLLEFGADINIADNYGWTPLMWAMEYDNENIVRMLLHHGADSMVKDKDGDTALMIASYHGNEEIVKLLLQKDGRVRMMDYNGGNALSIAEAQGNEAIMYLLSGK